MNLPYLQTSKDGVILSIRVTPKASQSKIAGTLGDELKVLIKAPPTDGKANQELIRFLSKTLNVSKSDIELISGETSRSKKVLLHCSVEHATTRLGG